MPDRRIYFRTRAAAATAISMFAASGLAQEVSPEARAPIEDRPGPFRAVFFEEPNLPLPPDAAPPPPSAPGKVRRGAQPPAGGSDAPDVYLADGSETALAIDVGNPSNLLGTINAEWFNTASMLVSSNANGSWVGRSFPGGGGVYTGYPFDPWAHSGNAAGELYATLIRSDPNSENTRCVIARTINGGGSFGPFYIATNRTTFQDREMVDLDYSTARGGGPGSTHDGKTFLCFDDHGFDGSGYTASVMHTVSTGGVMLSETVVSTNANFRGSKLQPSPGTVDGRVFLMGRSTSSGGASTSLIFHELNVGGAATYSKSVITYNTPGRKLGTSARWGLNGHRIETGGNMDIDRTNGARRGRIYVVSTRNPNPANASLDQADVYISYSTNNGSSWSSAAIPGIASGKSQYFPMMDVDENGYVHVAYYQNENGVVNSPTANVYYTFSTDGGATWATPAQVNAASNTLDYQFPPPNLATDNYYLVGDYAQIKVAGTGASTTAYVLWTGYDKDRLNSTPGNAKARAICTTVPPTLQNGACCVAGVCTANVSQTTCASQGGTFFAGQACGSVTCPLPNNNCSGAVVVSAGNTPFSTVGATTDGPAGCSVLADVWFRYTAPCGGQVTALIANTTLVPAMAVYAGATCPPGALQSCDTSGAGMATFTATAGTTYTIRVGSVTGTTGTGTLAIFPPTGPGISQHPASQSICQGGTASFSVVPAGGGTHTYQWRFNANPIPGATAATYTISNVQPSHVGSYSVVVSNACGSATSNDAALTIGSGTPPSITQQPAPALAASPGQSVSMSVSAAGTGLSYQWRRNGQNISNGGGISGATSATLTINPVQVGHDGTYTVVVNGCGSITSDPVVLCYGNCDLSTASPMLNVNDFSCFLNQFVQMNMYANCDGSTRDPVLNITDFNCFVLRYMSGCP